MKYSEFKKQLSDLFDKFESENECIIKEVDYKVITEVSNKSFEKLGTRKFSIKLL